MSNIKSIVLPDIGDFSTIDVIEVLVQSGDVVQEGDSLITLEGDKASMEIPTAYSGTITQFTVSVGDKVSQGDVIGEIQITQSSSEDSAPQTKTQPITENKTHQPAPKAPSESKQPTISALPASMLGDTVHASPIVRKTARINGIDLSKMQATGMHGRVVIDDLSVPTSTNTSLPPLPDFEKFGSIQYEVLSKIKKLSGQHLSTCWSNIPHVTQFDQVDITELEAFRQEKKKSAADQNIRLTALAFVIKACAYALATHPTFNASLDNQNNRLILKSYCNIGFAVDTPSGLVVPVIRNVDQLSIYEIAIELGVLSQKARDGKLTMADMQGGCLTVSSLGGIGGTYFTPIINAPEVAILGLSKAQYAPVWDKEIEEFMPRLMLPLSLSYDHRVIDGAQGARFIQQLNGLLSDIRTLLL